MLEFTMPFPPSVNHLYFHRAIKRRGSDKWGVMKGVDKPGKEYFQAVTVSLIEQGISRRKLDVRLAVEIVVVPPDRIRRDLDNICKAALDALTHANVWADDWLIDDLRIVRAGVEKPGRLKVKVAPTPGQTKQLF